MVGFKIREKVHIIYDALIYIPLVLKKHPYTPPHHKKKFRLNNVKQQILTPINVWYMSKETLKWHICYSDMFLKRLIQFLVYVIHYLRKLLFISLSRWQTWIQWIREIWRKHKDYLLSPAASSLPDEELWRSSFLGEGVK